MARFTMGIEELETVLGLDSEMRFQKNYYGRRADGATTKQKQLLRDLGVSTRGVMWKGHASYLISEILSRKEKGLASIPQLIIVIDETIKSPKNLKDLTFEEASELINRAKDQITTYPIPYQIWQIEKDRVLMFGELCETESDAEVMVAKRVRPEYDAKIVPYNKPYCKVGTKLFASVDAAREYAKTNHIFIEYCNYLK